MALQINIEEAKQDVTPEYEDFLDGTGDPLSNDNNLNKLRLITTNLSSTVSTPPRSPLLNTNSGNRRTPKRSPSPHSGSQTHTVSINNDDTKSSIISSDGKTQENDKESDTIDSSNSHLSSKNSFLNKSLTAHSNFAATYTSEYYESATRGSIDETTHMSNKSQGYGSLKHKKSKSKQKSKSKNKNQHKGSTISEGGTGNKNNNNNDDDDNSGSDEISPQNAATWTNKYTSMVIEERRVGGWDELLNLEQLFQLGMIQLNEYQERKQKLINKLTGTRINKQTQARFDSMLSKAQAPIVKRRLGETDIIKEVPNWVPIPEERAVMHSCAVNDNKEVWTQEMRIVKMATNPFNNGTLRYVYYMMDIGSALSHKKRKQATTITAAHSLVTPLPATHVAKISIDPMEETDSYFHDVAMQKHAQRFADIFNAHDVPKKVGFLDCWVYELVDRTPHIFCGVEKYIEGDYNKYTNNFGWVSPVERSTPQSFSHFTYEASKHKILICDLQGVGDLYTDPQMHTHDGKGCGKGNMGKIGIDKFLSSHRCNAICRYLKLPITNAQSAVQGTLPNKQYMPQKTIDTLAVSTQYTVPNTSATTSLLQSTNDDDQDNQNEESDQMQYFPKLKDSEDTKCKCKCRCVIL